MKPISKIYTIGLLSAMPEELGNTIDKLENVVKKSYGNLEIFLGNLPLSKSENINVKVITAWSGWGKVNSTYAATRLVCEAENQNLELDFIIFTGVAGAASSKLHQWDIVIAESLFQHDMDARPIFEKYVIPGLNLAELKMDSKLHNWAIHSLTKMKDKSSNPFGEIHSGLIATGDKFIDNKEEINKIRENFPDLKAVEMEGGAVSQVSILASIPLLVIRVISDNADNSAAFSFERFIDKYNDHAWDLINSLFLNIKDLYK